MTYEVAINGLPQAACCLLALLGWGAAGWLQRASIAKPWLVATAHTFRLGAAWGFWWLLLRMYCGLTDTAGTLPTWCLALAAATACEVVLYCYAARTDHPVASLRRRLATLAMPLLRLLVIGLLTIVLLQPVVEHRSDREEERIVAVLVDDSASMNLTSRSASDSGRTRGEVVDRLLDDNAVLQGGLLNALQDKYRLRLYRFGATALEVPPAHWRSERAVRSENGNPREASPWALSTDMASALQKIDGDLPIGDLSGVVVLSDGCDHSSRDVRQAAGQLIMHDVPVNTILIGSQSPVRDAEIVAVQSPVQVYHGDSVALRATVKIDEYQGRTATLSLLKDGEPVDDKTIRIATNRHRETVLFRHQPDDEGICEYTVRLEQLPDEEISANNVAQRHVWVSKDHVRVLLVDDRPRWEFRYLRNLFAGRDRTVFLQSVLLRPDRLAGVPDPPLMHASALRAFDDCEATALPKNRDEWLKFDVIILGDVPPESLGSEGVTALKHFVKDRGGSLIVIAGQHHMPHAFANTPLADLLPVRLGRHGGSTGTIPGHGYHLVPADAANSHVVLQQLGAGSESRLSLPQLTWRHPACEAKPGATVLAYAAEQDPDHQAVNKLIALDEQRRRALILWQRFGAGRVLQLTFDQTWRLRYGVGDKYHHQFWGQTIRWAAKDRLSAGTNLVRLGTDRMMYRGGDTVVVRARVLDANRNAITGEDIRAVVYRDGDVVQQVALTALPDSAGLLHGEVRDLAQSGKYRIELAGDAVDRTLATETHDVKTVSTEIAVAATDEAAELSDVVADATTPTQLADWTGGIVVTPGEAQRVLKSLGPPSIFRRERWTVPLWNSWPVMSVFFGCLSLEWVLRKSVGLV